MTKLCTLMMAVAALVSTVAVARAGPCSGEIAQVEQQVSQSRASANAAVGPAARQSVGAQLHHQPTPGSVASAQGQANVDAAAALERARKADAAGDGNACAKALDETKKLYGID